MIYPISRMPQEIPIGIQTEEGVCIVAIDCSPWVEQWPGMVCSAMHTRPGEDTAYPVTCEWDGHILRWVVSMADTENPGQGIVEIIGLADGKRKLSGKTHTKIAETSVLAPGEAPETFRPFVDQVLDAAARAEQAAKDAEEHKLDGFSPIVETSKSGKVMTIKITDAKGTKTATINDGADGAPGTPGRDGVDGKTPVKGVDYFDGKDGQPGRDGQDGYTPVKGRDYFDGTDGRDGTDGKAATVRIGTVTTLEPGSKATVSNSGTTTDAVLNFGIPRGADGEVGGGSGESGADGFSPIAKVTQTSTGATITITDKDGTTSATVSNGKDGAKGDTGDPGAPGVSPTVTTSKSGKVTTITIKDAAGTKTATINDGADGAAGKDGMSVTVKNVSTSSADGGSNVVTFSDGKTLTVKNGSKGSTGETGVGVASITIEADGNEGEADVSSVQPDWNQNDETAPDFIRNKPFCETQSDTLVWDGTLGVMDEGFGIFTKISDAVPTADDFTNGATLNFADETLEITGAEIQPYFNEDGFCNFDFVFVVVPRDNYASNIDGVDTVFPNAGLYTIVEFSDLTMTIPGYGGFVSIQQIDAKYIPENPNEVQQVVVYVANSDGINRIFNDEECTDMVGSSKLYECARHGKRVVVIDGNGCYDAVAVQHSQDCILYYTWTGSEVYTAVAYCAEYTPE